MNRLNIKLTKESLVVSTSLTAIVLALGTNSPAQAALLDGFTSGSLIIDTKTMCVANNAIDFQMANQADPCDDNPPPGDGAREWGKLGTFEVTSAVGDFGTAPGGLLLDLFETEGDIGDLMFPGFTLGQGIALEPDGTPASLDNFLRFDVDNSGDIGAGDMTYSFTELSITSEETDSGFDVTLSFDGFFEGIQGPVLNYGTSSEVINGDGTKVNSTLAIISGGIAADFTDLGVVGSQTGAAGTCASLLPDGITQKFIPYYDADCATAFVDPDLDVEPTTTDGVFAAEKVPEPGSVVGLLAAGIFAATNQRKRKNG